MPAGKILIVNNVVCRPFSTGPIIQPTGLVLQSILGVPGVTITPGAGVSEPVFVQGANTSLFFDDFEGESNAQSFNTVGGWSIISNFPQLTAPVGSGIAGGKAAQITWGISDNFVGLDHVVTGMSGRVYQITWQYKAQAGFAYTGANVDQVKKVLIVANQGDPQQIEVSVALAGTPGVLILMNQSVSGVLAINTNNAVVNTISNGAYHQMTLRVTLESAAGARDGQVELWVDGVYTLFSAANIGTGTNPITNVRIAGTFAGGSTQVQTEATDRIRVWTTVSPSGEPFFSSGSDTSLMFDNFDSYSTLAALQAVWTPSGEFGATQSLSTTGAHSPNNSWRITHHPTASPSDTDTVITRLISGGAGTPQFSVAEFWIKTIPGYHWQRQDATGTGEKSFILNQGGSPRYVFGGSDYQLFLAQINWNGAYQGQFSSNTSGISIIADGPGLTSVNSGAGVGSLWFIQNMNVASRPALGYMNDGLWHQYKIKFTPGTFTANVAGAAGDGKIECWCDGVQIMKYDGTDNTRAEFHNVMVNTTPIGGEMQLGGPYNNGPTPAQGDQYKDYDDVRIWRRG